MITYSVVGILYTRTCPLNCAHCIISSSPRETDKMRPEFAAKLIDQISPFSDTVCFTGGEPMLYYQEILPLIRRAAALGLKVTMVTGAGWVSQSKPHIARNRIEGLKSAGLGTLCVSWDRYHEEWCDSSNALLLIEHAKAIGLPITVRGVVAAEGAKAEIEQKLVTINVPYEKVPVIRLGHASTLPMDHFHFTEEVDRGGCGTVLTPTVEPDGSVYACCGPSRSSTNPSPLILGNVHSEALSAILSKGREDPILELIYRIGPFGMLRMLKSDPRFADLVSGRDGYTGICELCLDLCNSQVVIERLREQLSRREGAALLLAARMYQNAAAEAALMRTKSKGLAFSGIPTPVIQGELHA